MQRKESELINISRDVGIRAPVSKVLDCLAVRRHITQIWSNIPQTRQGTQSRMPRDPHYVWTYKKPDTHLDGWSDSKDDAIIGQLVTRSQTGLNTVTWTRKEEERQTLVTLQIQLELPTSLPGELNEQLVARESGTDLDTMLKNLKRRVEPEMAQTL